jgi:sulfite dehydrogenase (quinone) subunit SoeC
MHPAFSIIFFTTASGAGLGLLAWLGVLGPLGLLPVTPWFGVVGLGLGIALTAAGLLASMLHLGHPERAWRALSQWRTSWLSREGVASTATFLPVGLFGILWVFYGVAEPALGLASAAMAAVTLYCTGMIYASLKPVPQWRSEWVVPNYLSLAAMTGAILLDFLTRLWGEGRPSIGFLTLAAILLAYWLKESYWHAVDTARPATTIHTATGLGGDGRPVRMLDPPHTEENYLLREMGFRIGRKHAAKLRRIARLAGFVAPALLTLAALAFGGWFGTLLAFLAALSAGIGVAAERWLFFAEAKHTVTLYYGAVAA